MSITQQTEALVIDLNTRASDAELGAEIITQVVCFNKKAPNKEMGTDKVMIKVDVEAKAVGYIVLHNGEVENDLEGDGNVDTLEAAGMVEVAAEMTWSES